MRNWVPLCLYLVTLLTSCRSRAERLPDVRHLLDGSSKGDVNAQFMLGLAYESGRGVAQDFAEAARWYQKAADAGNPGAQAHLGNLYAEGRGVARDATAALKWYRRGGVGGDATAQTNLGCMYFNGEGGLQRDYVQAARWFSKAAAQHNPIAAANLATSMPRAWVCRATPSTLRICTWKLPSGAICTPKPDSPGSMNTGLGVARTWRNRSRGIALRRNAATLQP